MPLAALMCRPVFPRSFLAPLVLAMAMQTCPIPIRAQENRFSDPLGHTLAWTTPPARIVSLSPSLTEILFLIGCDEKTLVGRTRYCNWPAGSARIPDVGGIVDPSLEAILMANPDLVLTTRGNPLEFMEACVRVGVPVYAVEARGDLEHLFAMIEEIGAVTGRAEVAHCEAASLRQRTATIRGRTSALDESARPRVFHGELDGAHWTAGPGSFVDGLIGAAGGKNIASGAPSDWCALSLEVIVGGDPEVYLGCYGSEGIEREKARVLEILSRDPHWRATSLGRSPRLYLVEEDILQRPGPRLIDVLEDFARYLHPDLWMPDSNRVSRDRP